jgi:putative endonuclease
MEHYSCRGESKCFTGKYHCFYLIYYETFIYIKDAIAREKQIKNWPRAKKEELINMINPDWSSLNHLFIDNWPFEK